MNFDFFSTCFLLAHYIWADAISEGNWFLADCAKRAQQECLVAELLLIDTTKRLNE